MTACKAFLPTTTSAERPKIHSPPWNSDPTDMWLHIKDNSNNLRNARTQMRLTDWMPSQMADLEFD